MIYVELLRVAKKKTAVADIKLDESGKPFEEPEELNLGDNVIIVSQHDDQEAEAEVADSEVEEKPKKKLRKKVKKKIIKKRRVKR